MNYNAPGIPWHEVEENRRRALKQRLATAQNPKAHPEKLYDLAWEDEYYWSVLLDNPMLPGKAISHIYFTSQKSSSHHIPGGRYWHHMVKHHNTPDNVLRDMLKSKDQMDFDTYLHTIFHPNVSFATVCEVFYRKPDYNQLLTFWDLIVKWYPEGHRKMAEFLVEHLGNAVTVEGFMLTPTSIMKKQFIAVFELEASDYEGDLDAFLKDRNDLEALKEKYTLKK